MAVQKFVTYNVLDTDGQVLSEEQKIELSVVEESGNYLLHKDISRHQKNKRQWTVSTKTRSEVRGGGRKPWQQKGTGRARAGSNTSPLWKGGGVIFGPKPKQITYKLNQKERQLALQTLLYNKRNAISIINDLETSITTPSTKAFSNVCKNCSVFLEHKTLIIVSNKTNELKLATRNLKNVELISASCLNTLSLLKAKSIILTPSAISDIKEIYCD